MMAMRLGVPIGIRGMGWGSPYGVMDLGVPMGGHRVGCPHCYPCVVCGVPILSSWGHWMALGSPLAAVGWVGGPHWQS